MSMAEEKKPAAASAPADAATKPKGGFPLPILIALYVGVALAGAAVAERVIAPNAARRASAADAKAVVQQAPGEHAEKGEVEHAGASGNVYVIDDLVVNPAGSGGLRYLAASVGLRSSAPTFLEDMKTRDAPIKDALIRILGSKTTDELANVQAREGMRAEIQQEVGRIIPEQKVDAIYFTRFVLQ